MQHLTTRSGYVRQVDGMRAVAALSVVFFHQGVMPIGWGGVWIFFVISGFVITRGLISKRFSLSVESYKQFTLGRITRIWPLYFLYIALGLGLASMNGEGLPGGEWQILRLLTFTDNFVFNHVTFTAMFSHLWTISVEQQFYVVYPFAFAWAVAARRPAVVLSGLLVASLIVRILAAVALMASGDTATRTGDLIYMFSIGHFDAFFVGALAAFYPERLVRMRRQLGIGAIVLAVVALGFGLAELDHTGLAKPSIRAIHDGLRPMFGSEPYAFGSMIWCYVLWEVAAAALLAQAPAPGGVVNRVLGWGPLVSIGQVSYGIYIWQFLVAPAFYDFVGVDTADQSILVRALTVPLYVALLYCVARASYYGFEVRFHRRIGLGAGAGKRLATREQGTAAAGAD